MAWQRPLAELGDRCDDSFVGVDSEDRRAWRPDFPFFLVASRVGDFPIVGPVPSGTVTFLFTDVEGSTRFWEERPAEARTAMALHDELVHGAVVDHGGYVFSTAGDGFAAAFSTPTAAIEAAVDAQRRLSAASWPGDVAVSVRMGVHTGTADERDGDYFGPAVNRAARLMSAAHGGQIVVSGATQRLVTGAGPEVWALRALGEFRLKDLDLPELVFQVAGDGLRELFPPLRAATRHFDSLPVQTTSFVGREELVRAVIDAVRSHRLITLVAGGGFGKTRLALQTAAELSGDFDGMGVVQLAPVRDAAQVTTRVIESMGWVAAGSTAEAVDRTLVERARDQTVLVVMDNCEHLVDECARVAELLLTKCVNVRVLATSRQPLGVHGERLIPVDGLGVPALSANAGSVAQSPAGALFVDRAGAVRPDFTVTDANAAAVAAICRQVEGLPLAIELAAARVRALSVSDIADRLTSSMRVLASTARVGDARHQTMEACLRWSFETLDPDAAAVLRRLSVFAGEATLPACAAVCAGDDLDALEVEDHLVTLVDRSLVEAEDGADGTRYRLHELVRQFAAERLVDAGERDPIRSRHLDWYTALVKRHSPGVRSLSTLGSVEPLLAEVDNLAVAVSCALEQKNAAAAARILGGGGEMWAHVGRMRQLGDWWTSTLPLLPDAPDVEFPPNRLALAKLSAGTALGNNGRCHLTFELAERALRLDGVSEDAIAFGHWLQLAFRQFTGGDPQALIPALETLVQHATARKLGVEYATRCILAWNCVNVAALQLALQTLHPILDSTGDAVEMHTPTALALTGLAEIVAGRVDEGLAVLDDVAQQAEIRTTHWRYAVLTFDTTGRLLAGQSEQAAPSARRALTCVHESSMYPLTVPCVEATALLSARLGARQLALDALAAVDRDLDQYGGQPISARPGTILHPVRNAIERELRLDDLRVNPATVEDMSDRLRHHFEQLAAPQP
jgi:predicted ATPase/class 3 adenylate cyclase